MDELVCRKCNKCKEHCRCPQEAQELDIPFPEQLAIAKYEWQSMGVRV
jgi:hypothetical protein